MENLIKFNQPLIDSNSKIKIDKEYDKIFKKEENE